MYFGCLYHLMDWWKLYQETDKKNNLGHKMYIIMPLELGRHTTELLLVSCEILFTVTVELKFDRLVEVIMEVC